MSILVFKSKDEVLEPQKSYWTNQDIADFYRAKDILEQAGLDTETDAGITDEGDPWFVFIRPETGDVIAHFAQMDGQFVAVSSLNQEIYKGRNIRSIVDQMLERHPMLLPQNKNGARIFLHPTAALSAFLAAAFILSIDGVKASDLTTIMVGSATENLKDLANETGAIDNNLRGDLLRSMVSDLDPSNYNVAMLGAALIAFELSHNYSKFYERTGLEESVLWISDPDYKVQEKQDENTLINGEQRRELDDKVSEGYSFPTVDVNVKEDQNEQREAKANNAEVQNKKSFLEESRWIDLSVQTDHVSVQELQGLWGDINLVPNIKYQSIYEGGTTDIESHLEATVQFDVKPKDVMTGAIFFGLLEQFQGALKGIPSDLGSLDFDGLGVRIDEEGGLRMLSLGALDQDQDNEVTSFNEVPFSSVQISETFMNTNVLRTSDKVGYFEAEKMSPIIETPSSSSLTKAVPILGHVLTDSGESIQLTEAIDVIFYKGGDAEISNFELGTDLLWFFLSPEQLSSSENSVNDRGDLELNFGDLGTLTFFGMLSDPSLDTLV
jgi:hypothetical protein